MSDNKKNPNAASNSKLTESTMDTKIQDSFYCNASDGLDDVVIGGCSACGSVEHETVKCDRKDVQSEFMMSGALQTDTDSSPCASATTAAPLAEQGGQAQPGKPVGQDAGRRRSV